MSLPGLRGWFTPNMFCGFSIVFLCKHAIDGHLWPRLLWLASFVMSSSWLQVQFITTLSLWCDLFMMCYYNILWYYFTHPQAIRWVSSWEQIWRNVALLHLLRNGLSAVNGCRQNESPNSWYKHHNNPHNSSPSVNILRSEKLHVCKKQIH